MVALLIFGWAAFGTFLEHFISEEWSRFISANIMCLFFLIWCVYLYAPFKRYSKGKLFLFQIVFYLLIASVAYLLLLNGWLPQPRSMHIYFVIIGILTMISLVILIFITTKWDGYFKRKTKGPKED
jgi:hypothetical protein